MHWLGFLGCFAGVEEESDIFLRRLTEVRTQERPVGVRLNIEVGKNICADASIFIFRSWGRLV